LESSVYRRAKVFTYNLALKNLRNSVASILIALFPIGWICFLISVKSLLSDQRNPRFFFNFLSILTLSNLLVKKVGGVFLCKPILQKIRFYAPDLDVIHIYYHIWIRGDYEKFANPCGIIIDVGAHVGLFALKSAGLMGSLLIIAIEPCPNNSRFFKENLQLNRLEKKVALIEAAAGNMHGQTRLWISKKSGSHSLNPKDGEYFVRVDLITLDELVKTINLPRIDYIKIDVEGTEFDVLEGAQEILERFKPVVVMETNNIKKCQGLLKTMGYTIYVTNYIGELVHLTAIPSKNGSGW